MFPNDNLDDGLKTPEDSAPVTPQPNTDNASSTSVPPVESLQAPTVTPLPDQPTIQPETPQSAPVQPNPTQSPSPQLPDTSQMFVASTPVSPPKKSHKKLIIIILVILLVIASVAGYVFAIYLPSKPENVYSTAMDRTGQALEEVTAKVSSKSEIERFKNGEYNGVAKIDYPPMKIDGNFGLKYNSSKLDFNIDAKVTEDGQKEKSYSAQVLAEKKEGAKYPDVYFIVKGIKELGLGAYMPAIDSLDSTWIKVDEKYIQEVANLAESYAVTTGGDTDVTNDPPQVTSQDIEEFGKIFSSIAKEYVFTSDPSKAVIDNKGFISKEKIDGLNTYHYSAAINKENYLKACKDASSQIYNSAAYKRMNDAKEQDIKKTIEEAAKGCEQSSEDIKDNETFDMWVDAKYKLVYKIRVTEESNPDASFEVGQKYTGGDDLHFFANYEDKKDKTALKMTFDINTKSLVSKVTLDGQSDDETAKGKVGLSFEGKPLEGDITMEKPTNPKSLEQIMKDLGLTDSQDALDPLVLGTSGYFDE